MLSLLALLLTAPAHADEALRSKCIDLLAAYDDPATAEDWRALGDGAPAELMAIARDSKVSSTRRAGAVLALGWFPTPETRTYVTTVLYDVDAANILRRKATFALGNGWGEQAMPELVATLASEDVQLRQAAARAIAKLGTPAAKTALQERLTVEPDRVVRDLIVSLLSPR
jgi:HEAT repeat protein